MQKTLGDMAAFLKQIIPSNIPNTYTIKTEFLSNSNEEDVKRGIKSFRDFMYNVCDEIVADKKLGETPIKGKKHHSDENALTGEFPFLNNIRSILLNIGYLGHLSSDGKSLLVENGDILSLKRSANKNSTAKISNSQMIKALRFFTKCGLVFDGIDLSEKKPDLSNVSEICVSYPKAPIMMTAMKTLSIADYQLATRLYNHIMLRSDFRALDIDNNTDATATLNQYIKPLPESVANFVLSLHEHFLSLGMVCNVEYRVLSIHFHYFNKKKPICRFTASLNNGFRMIIKSKNTSKYPEVIESFKEPLRSIVKKGYGCDRKFGSGHGNCQGGCEGFKFALDEGLVAVGEDVRRFVEAEIGLV